MTRALPLLLSGTLLAAAPADDSDSSSRWRHNTRSRTDRGIEARNEGATETAQHAFETALGLAPLDPLMQFNAGTAGLDSRSQEAAELLRRAAESATPELQPLAFYNLGNARFAANEFEGAIEAYEESLRRAPGNLDAKHNLELAWKKLEEQQQQQEQQNDERQEQNDEQQQQQNQDSDESRQEPPQEQPGDPSQPERSQRPLPEFEDQPDMTAEQAAAILEAVENLEREQRRKQALEQLKRAKGDRDW